MGQAAKADNGIVNIHGKQYKTVALRISEFRDEYPEHGVETEIVSQADLVTVKATITNTEGRTVATGYAEENRAFGNINKTSAVENAETSAVGRALAFFGLGGTEIASADEVANAIGQQEVAKIVEPLMRHNGLVREHVTTISAMKESLATEDYGLAKEAWQELSEDDQRGLWVAPSKGGVFTTREREQMKSPEWAAA